MERFIAAVSKRFHLDAPVLTDLWHRCSECRVCEVICLDGVCKKHDRCTYEIVKGARQGDLCNKPSLKNSRCSLHQTEIKYCPILLQSGSRQHKPCEKVCAPNQTTCSSHRDLKMCESNGCTKTSTTSLCIFHQKEAERDKLKEKPFISLRVHAPYFVIKGSMVVFDPALHKIVGHIEADVFKNECTELVQRYCEQYQVQFHMKN